LKENMVRNYAQIQKEIEHLKNEADKRKKTELSGVVARIREAIEVYGLTAQDLGLAGRGGRRKAGSVPKTAKLQGKPARAIKFKDASGNTWGGRGPRPAWLREALAAGKALADFAV
jgi:DNA-binding protein H-NS